jgi:hypothetical protein
MSENGQLAVKYMPLEQVQRWELNPKPHDIGALVTSIQRYGFKDPMKLEPTLNGGRGGIVEGNGRAEALAALKETGEPPPRGVAVDGSGTWLVPILVGVDADTESEAAAYAIDHNALTVLGGNFGQDWAERLYDLDELLPVLTDLDLPPVSIDGDDLDALLDREPEPETEPVPEPPDEPTSKRGEVYELGRHRLMCGDAVDDAHRLLDGQGASVLLTDPPYGMSLDTDFSGMKGKLSFMDNGGRGNRYDEVTGDERHFDAAPVATGYAAPVQFWFGADYYADSLGDTRHSGSWLVWDKRLDESADRIFGSAFELIWSRTRRKREILRCKWAGVFGLDTEKRFHPTQKPTALLVSLLERADGDLVADPFAGSGSTLIAAEQTGRTCYAMEIEPKYCDVIRRRYAEYVKDDSYLP